MSRVVIYNKFFSARALFITGLIIMPALLFNPCTELRVIQFLFFWFLAFFTGKKTNIVFTLLVTIFIIAFNLIIPYGRVLYSICIFKITSGALEAGIHRAVTLQALMMLSKAFIRQDLKLPGAFGGLLSESLRLFSLLMGRKFRIFRSGGTKAGVIANIDNMMLELSSDSHLSRGESAPGDVRVTGTKLAGFVILAVVTVLSWLPWIFI